MTQNLCGAALAISRLKVVKCISAAVLGSSVIFVHCRNSQNSCAFTSMNTHTCPVHTSCSVGSQYAFTYSKLHPHVPLHPAVVFPALPQGCDSGHLYSKSTLMWQETQTHKTLCHLGLISPHLEQLWPKLSCVAVGRRRNAGRTSLCAPAEGKLQGAASPHNSGENVAAALEFAAKSALNPLVFDISFPCWFRSAV